MFSDNEKGIKEKSRHVSSCLFHRFIEVLRLFGTEYKETNAVLILRWISKNLTRCLSRTSWNHCCADLVDSEVQSQVLVV